MQIAYLFLFPMKPPDLLEDLAVVALGKIHVDQLADEELHWSALLLLDGWSLGRVNIIDSILNEHALCLANVLYRLFALECLQKRRHPW